MLEELLNYLKNWFVVDCGIHENDYSIKDNTIELSFLQSGQYFRICGSVFNDGLHQYPCNDLFDEDFHGTVWALAIPKAVVKLSEDIKDWQEKNPVSTFTSESFGGYSYSKLTGANGQPLSWQDVFKRQLNQYRKIAENAAVRGRILPPPFDPYDTFNDGVNERYLK